MKRMICSLLTICMLLVSFVNVCYAAGLQPLLSAEDGEVGDTVIVTVSLPANSNAAGGSFNLVYDNTKLELVDAAAGSVLAAFSKTVNKTYADNALRVNFAGSETVSADGGIMLYTTFRLIEAGTATVSVENFKLANLNAEYLPCADNSAQVAIEPGEELPEDVPTDPSEEAEAEQLPTDEPENEDEAELWVPAENPFTDVTASDWYYDAVIFAYTRGITSGVTDTTFAPQSRVTRGQFITMLCRAYGVSEMYGDNFVDCGNTWYTGYLAAAKQLGISNGIGDDKFAPEKEITREEMVTLLYNYLASVGAAGTSGTVFSFADGSEVSVWARDAVTYASANGIVNGKDGNRFDPQGKATRAELVQIFYNILS